MPRHILLSVLLALLISNFSTAQDVVADWAKLARFADMNAQLEIPSSDKRIVFMGNSITEGWPKYDPELWENSSLINRGISGQTTAQMLIRFRQDVIDLEPDAVVILAGTNDIAQNGGPVSLEFIRDNIFSMCELAAANEIEVVLCAIVPAGDYPWRPGLEPAEKIVRINNWLEEYARKKGHLFVDYHKAMATSDNAIIEDYAYDGVHPNAKGYKVMLKALKEQLPQVAR